MLASGGEAADICHRQAQVFIWIDGRVVDADFVMEVRAGAAAAQADIADKVTALNVLSVDHGETGKVAIASPNPMAMVDHYGFAVSAEEISKGHYPVCRRNDRLPVGRGDVHSAVESTFAIKWINTLAERPCNRTFDGPEIRGRVGARPVSSGDVTCHAERQAGHGRSGQR